MTVAVIDGGIWIRVRDGVTAEDALVHNHPQSIEVSEITEAMSLELNKQTTESVSIGDSLFAELNPPVVVQETPEVSDAVVLATTKALSDAASVSDTIQTTLNP